MKNRLLLAAAISWAAAAWLAGQEVHARIDGYVQDEGGRFLAGVEVTAVNIASHAETKVVSDKGNGGFRFLGLAPGAYQVSCDLEGYESYVAGGIRLSAGQSTTLRVKLKRLPGTEAPPPADAPQEDAQGPWKRWQVELAIGRLASSANDLNLFVGRGRWLVREQYLIYLHDPRFVSVPYWGLGMELGALHPLANRVPLAARLRLHLNRTFSLAVGMDWTDQRRESHCFVRAPFDHLDSGTRFNVDNEMSVFQLEQQAFFPYAGMQAILPLNAFVSLAGYLHGGWAFVQCRHASVRQFQDGFAGVDRLYDIALSGKGGGPALEGGAKFEFVLWRGFGLFAEGFSQWFRVDDVNGEQVTYETILDEGAPSQGTVIRETMKGRWRVTNNAIPWPFIPPADQAEFYRPASLDLGGAGFRIGAYFRF